MKLWKELKKQKLSGIDKMRVLATILLVVLIPVSALLIRDRAWRKLKAGPGPALLILNPEIVDAKMGQTGSFNVILDPSGVEVTGVELVVDYDSSVIKVTDVSAGTFFTDAGGTANETIKDLGTAGRVHYQVSFNEGGLSSSTLGGVAVISFEVVDTGTSPMTFVVSESPETQVFDITSSNVLDVGVGGTVTVTNNARLFFEGLTPINPQVVGNSFEIKVMVDTDDHLIDGVDAKISFDTNVLEVVSVDQGIEPGFNSYPALKFNNGNGTVNISANVGGGNPAVSGSSLHLGTIIFQANQTAASSLIEYKFEGVGKRNDSNIVLSGLSKKDAVDILTEVDPAVIVVTEVQPSPTPTPTPSPTPTPTPSPTPTPTPSPTPTPTPSPAPQTVTMSISFQGRTRDGVSRLKNLSFWFKPIGGSVSPELNLTTDDLGNTNMVMDVGYYQLLFKSPGYLARRYGSLASPIVITEGQTSLDLTGLSLLGGDFNEDGIVNEVDYSLHFLANFLLIDDMVDLDGSGEVNNLDFGVMRNNWGYIDDVFE